MIVKYLSKIQWNKKVTNFLIKKLKKNKKKTLNLILTGGNSSKPINKFLIYKLYNNYNLNIYISDERCTRKKEFLNQTFFQKINKKKRFNFFPILKKNLSFLKSAKMYNNLINFNPDLILLSVAKDGHIASIFNLNKEIKFKNVILSKSKLKNFRRISISKNYLEKSSNLILLCNSLERYKNFEKYSKNQHHILSALSKKKKLLVITKN